MRVAIIPARGGSERSTALRFWFWKGARLVHDATSCWDWQRSRGSHGYGQFYEERGKPLLAHRYAWTITHGAIPHGKYVLHRCDNKKCVRPDHLFLGTQADNMADMNAKGRHGKVALRGEQNPRAKLNIEAIQHIRANFIAGTRQQPGNALLFATKYGVARALIYAIAARKIWRHVP